MSPSSPGVRIFGVRHHGPGSARSLLRALEELQPDAVLVEGPPDADGLLPLLADAELRPPVALLVYVPDEPRRAVYFPLAEFSPEWQALRYALARGVPARFMDLPQWHQLAAEPNPPAEGEAPRDPIRSDPLGALAEAAGYGDGERWWEHMIEHRRDGADAFAAVQEAMAALRAGSPAPSGREAQREAWMRQTIRAALTEGHERVAVVCGAWHAPALADTSGARGDAALLKGLPRAKTSATLVPWTYGRLTYASGYGAGVESPGWYHHLWHHPEQTVVRWMTGVARLLRAEDLDASSAHVIEAVRLAEALAALRGRALPGLAELNEASQAVLCFGQDAPMRLIAERLIVSERLGTVPDSTPMVPLQQDLRREQRRLRLPAEATWKDYDLDLRKPTDLERSHLLRRLSLLDVDWGALRGSAGTGSFRETWRLEWRPELDIELIEAGIWGTTIADAAAARAINTAERAELPELVGLATQALLAELPAAVAPLMQRLAERAARSADVAQLMDALVREDPLTRASLAGSLRYGGVRKTDAAAIEQVVDGLAARICIGLPGACAALDDEAAGQMYGRITAVDSVLRLLQNAEHLAMWHLALRRTADMRGVHGLVAGGCCRILLDARSLEPQEAASRLSQALSRAASPADAGAWLEGLLRGSGALLLHDELLWPIVDAWVSEIGHEAFKQALPLLRRTFATFSAPERRALGERAREGQQGASPRGARASGDFDIARAEAALPLVARLLGVTP